MAAFEDLLQRIETTEARIAVIGMGYVGIPLALAGCAAGYSVCGFDTDSEKVATLNLGKSYIKHVGELEIAKFVEARRLRATNDFSELRSADAILICVPTPLTRYRDPDLRFVVETAQTIARYVRPGQLVVLESTTYPGTTEEVLEPILGTSGLTCGNDYFLAYSPEREDPGNREYKTRSIPKVVGGRGARALHLAAALYGKLFERIVTVSSTQTAEAVKLTENIFRAINIALINELKVVFSAMNIDVWEVIEAAKTKPFGFMPFYPGPGLGGHCIPIDPFYLTWKAREFDISTRFIELAGQINTAMPQWVVDRLVAAVDKYGRGGLRGARVLLVGLAYKKNIDDVRESPSFKLLELIEARGATVDYYDPHVPIIPNTREHVALAGRRSIVWDRKVVADYDAVLISTDHDDIDYGVLVAAKLVIDTRNACARRGIAVKAIVKA